MKYYLINEDDLKLLIEDSLILTALYQGGVDNWQWYGESIEDLIKTWIEDNQLDSTYPWTIQDIVKSDLKQYYTPIEKNNILKEKTQ